MWRSSDEEGRAFSIKCQLGAPNPALFCPLLRSIDGANPRGTLATELPGESRKSSASSFSVGHVRAGNKQVEGRGSRRKTVGSGRR
jgi:hypothetical protein